LVWADMVEWEILFQKEQILFITLLPQLVKRKFPAQVTW